MISLVLTITTLYRLPIQVHVYGDMYCNGLKPLWDPGKRLKFKKQAVSKSGTRGTRFWAKNVWLWRMFSRVSWTLFTISLFMAYWVNIILQENVICMKTALKNVAGLKRFDYVLYGLSSWSFWILIGVSGALIGMEYTRRTRCAEFLSYFMYHLFWCSNSKNNFVWSLNFTTLFGEN